MDTGEIIALVFILLVLAIGTVFICWRCWRTVLEEMKDAQASGRVDSNETTFTRFRNVLRDSVRSSVRRAGGSLRRSFRRARPEPRPQLGNTPPVTVVATVEELKEGKSELHPKYFQKKEQEGEVRQNGRLEPVPGDVAGPSDVSLGVHNPLYHQTESGKADPSNPNISNTNEPSVRQQYNDMSSGYDQPVDNNYFSEIGDNLADALPAGRVPDDEETGNERSPHPADDAMASYQAQHDGSTELDNQHLETDTYI